MMPQKGSWCINSIQFCIALSAILFSIRCVAQTLPSPPCGNEKALVFTHTLESTKGVIVSITYRALKWGPLTMRAIEDEGEQTQEFRLYYTGRVAPRLGMIRTNVMLTGPGFQLAPGIYEIGFKYLGNQQWAFVVHSENPGRADQTSPIQIATELSEVPFLAMNWVPGSSEDRFDLVIHYGPYKVTLPIQVSGIPTTTVGGQFDLQVDSQSAGAAMGSVSSAELMSASHVMPVTAPELNAIVPRLSPSERWEARSPTPVKRAQSGVDR